MKAEIVTYCTYCGVKWPVLQGEHFCGFCGHRITSLTLDWTQRLIYSDQSSVDIELWLRNNTFHDLEIAEIAVTPDGAAEIVGLLPRDTIPGQGRKHLAVSLKLRNSLPEQLDLTVRAHGGLDHEATINIPILAPPRVEIVPIKGDRIIAVIDPVEGSGVARAMLRVNQSVCAIERIESDAPWIEKIEYEPGHRISAPGTWPIQFTVRSQLLNAPTDTELRIHLAGRDEPIVTAIKVYPLRLPMPEMPSAGQCEVHEGRQTRHTFAIRNNGQNSLRIEGVNISSAYKTLLSVLEFPSEIGAGKSASVVLTVDASATPVDFYDVPVDIQFEHGVTRIYRLQIEVKKLEEYLHYVAIDFGTTNTYCCYLEEDEFKILPIPLEPRIEGVLRWDVPSAIIYRDTGGAKDYLVGNEADAAQTGRDAPYYVRSVKRWLGYRWQRRFPIEGQLTVLEPSEVVADILRHVRGEIEKHLGKRIARCIVSHPTMFSQRQVQDLRLALQKVGFCPEDILLIDEASAVAIHHVYKRKTKKEAEGITEDKYSLLVYDFGGGTIDIVLASVSVAPGRIEIRPLSWGGNPRFGGDEVTQAIVDHIINYCKEKIAQNPEYAHVSVEIPRVSGNHTFKGTGNEIYESALMNTRGLSSLAEARKLALSKMRSTQFPLVDYVRVVLAHEQIKGMNEIMQENHVEISQEWLEKEIRPILQDTLSQIEGMIHETGLVPDAVVLAGQSSRIPLVKRMLSEYFEAVHERKGIVQLVEDLKGCVAQGAAQYALTRSFTGDARPEVLEYANRTHSRFGIVHLVNGRPQFLEFVRKGLIIPGESYGRWAFPLSPGVILDVREHFGTGTALEKGVVESLGKYRLPDYIDDRALQDAELEMRVLEDETIEVYAYIGQDVLKFDVQREMPPFEK